jgi:uncharacterized protein DUF6152
MKEYLSPTLEKGTMRTILSTLVALMLTASLAFGHHGYAEYDRSAPVTLEGTILHVMWANPHVIVTLKTQREGEYTIEWRAISQLWRDGITSNPLKEGDHLIVTGPINRNPEKHILTLVREMSRPADGWHWVNASNSTPARK